MPFHSPQSPKDAIAALERHGDDALAAARRVGAEIKAEAAYDVEVIDEEIDAALDAVDGAIEREDQRIEAAEREAARCVKGATDALRGR